MNAMHIQALRIAVNAHDREGDDLEAFLLEQCGDNDALHQEVRRRLEVGEQERIVLRSSGDKATGKLLHPQAGREIVPDFYFLDELGRGGMGIVYKVWQRSLGRECALKMPGNEIQHETGTLDRFQREAMMAARLKHPHIVEIYQVGEHEGQPFFVMELLGNNLRKRLEGRLLPVREAARLLEQLSSAVAHAHSCRIVHRDLKPANILFLGDIAKITDFGIARDVEARPSTRTGEILGTSYYMAPEQVDPKRGKVLGQADVWALGVILYEMLTGLLPFRGETELATLQQVCHDEPIAPRRLRQDVPADLERLCLRCLEKELGQRVPSASDLAEDLGRFREHQRMRFGGPLSLVGRTRKFARRHPAIASTIAVAILVVVGIAYFVFDVRSRNADLTKALGERDGAIKDLTRTDREKTTALIARDGAIKDMKHASYFQGIALAHSAWVAFDDEQAIQVLNQCDSQLCQWEWHYLRRLFLSSLLTVQGPRTGVNCVALCSDGRLLANGASNLRAIGGSKKPYSGGETMSSVWKRFTPTMRVKPGGEKATGRKCLPN
jgi:hypothetical protein